MAAANPTRTRAKKSVAKTPVVSPADFEPIEITTEDDSNDELLVHLFTVNGVPYHVSGAQDVGIALRYLRVAADEGEAKAILWLLEEVLSPEGLDALLSIPRLKPETLAKLAKAVQKIVMGAMEVPKG